MDKLNFDSDNIPDKKISTTLWEFALPLINQINEHTTEAQIENGFIMLVTIWNAAVKDRLNDSNTHKEILRQSMKNAASLQLLDRYIRRKNKYFFNDLRMISDFTVTFNGGYLKIEAKGTVDDQILRGLKKH